MSRRVLVAATTNPHKLREIRYILRGSGIAVRSLDRFPPLPAVRENGRTLEDNALKKARAVSRALGLPALADDSGLFVPALNGRPGVRSARFSGPDCDYARNNAKLLRLLRNRTGRQRRAYFATAMALVLPGGGEITRIGKIHGRIGEHPQGTRGFGYDPVFRPVGSDRTFAQMSPREKNRISHRALALRHIVGPIRRNLR